MQKLVYKVYVEPHTLSICSCIAARWEFFLLCCSDQFVFITDREGKEGGAEVGERKVGEKRSRRGGKRGGRCAGRPGGSGKSGVAWLELTQWVKHYHQGPFNFQPEP